MGREYDLECADESATIVLIDGLRALRIELFELSEEHLRRLLFELPAKFRLRRNFGKDIVARYRIDIESGSSAQDRNMVLFYDGADRPLCKSLVLRNRKGSLWRSDIKKMMGDTAHFFFGDLARSDVETRVDLA